MRHQSYADSECPDQPAHLSSLIRNFTVPLQTHWVPHTNTKNNQSPCVVWYVMYYSDTMRKNINEVTQERSASVNHSLPKKPKDEMRKKQRKAQRHRCNIRYSKKMNCNRRTVLEWCRVLHVLGKALLISTHNICFRGEISKISILSYG